MHTLSPLSKQHLHIFVRADHDALNNKKVTFASLKTLNRVTQSNVKLPSSLHKQAVETINSLKETLKAQNSKVLNKKMAKLNDILTSVNRNYDSHAFDPASLKLESNKIAAENALKSALEAMYMTPGDDIGKKYTNGREALKNSLNEYFHRESGDNNNVYEKSFSSDFYDIHSNTFMEHLAENYNDYATRKFEEKKHNKLVRQERRKEREKSATNPSPSVQSTVAVSTLNTSKSNSNIPRGLIAAWVLHSDKIQNRSDKIFNGKNAADDLAKLVNEGEYKKHRMLSNIPESKGGFSGLKQSLKNLDGENFRQLGDELNQTINESGYIIGNNLYRGVSNYEADLWRRAGEGNDFKPERFSSFSFNEKRAENFSSGWVIVSDKTRGIRVNNYYPGRDEEEFLTSRSSIFTINQIDNETKRIFVSQH
ncbi:hypothetical protein AAF463_24095 (plasmid) [Pantoea sp. BJ2]|uniref:NAD(+)--protein-arginine ADP-ribosyltransferase n=1 Tax=Pantoea sp. BJ2 TaxID=3141322 RepID=A0AAU7U4C0_9GAMM